MVDIRSIRIYLRGYAIYGNCPLWYIIALCIKIYTLTPISRYRCCCKCAVLLFLYNKGNCNVLLLKKNFSRNDCISSSVHFILRSKLVLLVNMRLNSSLIFSKWLRCVLIFVWKYAKHYIVCCIVCSKVKCSISAYRAFTMLNIMLFKLISAYFCKCIISCSSRPSILCPLVLAIIKWLFISTFCVRNITFCHCPRISCWIIFSLKSNFFTISLYKSISMFRNFLNILNSVVVINQRLHFSCLCWNCINCKTICKVESEKSCYGCIILSNISRIIIAFVSRNLFKSIL